MPEVNDDPIAFREDGSPVFDNTPTVVCMMLKNENGRAIVVRRNNNPGKGLIGLPGGYHMAGETWQEAGARELFEETGYVIDPEFVHMVQEPVTDEYGNNLIIASYFGGRFSPMYPGSDDVVRDVSFVKPDEVAEVLYLDDAGEAVDWAFPRHFEALREGIAQQMAEQAAEA